MEHHYLPFSCWDINYAGLLIDPGILTCCFLGCFTADYCEAWRASGSATVMNYSGCHDFFDYSGYAKVQMMMITAVHTVGGSLSVVYAGHHGNVYWGRML